MIFFKYCYFLIYSFLEYEWVYCGLIDSIYLTETIEIKDREGTAALCLELQSALGEVQERVLEATQSLVQKT